jgi:hypothetical protein
MSRVPFTASPFWKAWQNLNEMLAAPGGVPRRSWLTLSLRVGTRQASSVRPIVCALWRPSWSSGGALSENVTPLPVLEMIAKIATVKGHNIWLTSGNPDKLKTAVAFIRRGFDEVKLKPLSIGSSGWTRSSKLIANLEANNQFGKIVAPL